MQRSTRSERTLAQAASVRGVGFFHGADVTCRFLPAGPGTGIVFERTDLPDRPTVPARIDRVVPSQRRTAIREGAASVEMIEHVMAALAGLHIDNCLIQIDAGECPGCDGSSRPFVQALDEAGTVEQPRARQALVIEEAVSVREGDAVLGAGPGMPGQLTLAYHLDYGSERPIPPQSFCVGVSPQAFRDQLAGSRTFVLESEANALRAAGIGARATPADLLIFGDDGVIGNTLRFDDECARHKVLDLLGDLALLGFDLHGSVIAHRSGHQTNHALVRRLFESLQRSTGTSVKSTAAAADTVLDIQRIMRLLPHRYPFLLIDRVIELEPRKRAVAVKNVSYNEPFFAGHWPGLPIMPGVLIVEAIAQAAGVLISASIDDTEGRVAVIASIDGVKIRRPVVPGDQLRLEVEGERFKHSAACVSGLATVSGALVAEAKLRFILVDAAQAAKAASCAASASAVPIRA
jgi:UDP-3-O-[3-hydroxymyristoyl] N-acetylglucosamine deacetylase/3-hydroxyacyl-[acyl-carrier-protein] dehydratase